MQYSELKKTLLEYMENGVTISLKSMVNSIFLCRDVQDIRLAMPGFAYNSFDELSSRKTTYMSSYILDSNKKAVFNNRAVMVMGKNQMYLGDIWFGRDDLLSLSQYQDRYGQEIPMLNGYNIDWINDNVYIVSIGNNLADANKIFGSR